MAINYGKLNAKLNPRGSLKARMGVSGPLNSDYEALINKPQINGNELIGDKSNEQLGIPTKLSEMDNDDNYVQDEDYQHTDNNYDDTDKGKVDALGTASTKNVPAEGNASASEVVMGSDTRLNDSRNAKDVYDWAKAQTKPSYSYSEIQNTPAINNPTITIQKNNQNVDSFTLNQDSNKSINISVPTKTSDLQNDNSFITNTVDNLANYYLKTQTYTQTEVDALIQAAINGRFQKVNSLPASGEPNVIYLVPKTTPETSNACDEYIWQDNAWELIGSTEIDLSDYVTDEDLATALQSYLTTSAFATAIANYYTKTEVGTLLDNKVDKVNGKGLSTYDYDATAKAIVDSVTASLAAKVDKVAGKGLSTNDYDNTAKGIVDGVTAALADKVDKVEGKGLSTNDYTTAEKDKLGGIANNATKVESSNTNGNIKINNTETQVYDDTLVREAISDLNDDVEGIQDVITTDTTSISGNPLSIVGLKSTQNAINPIVTLEPIQDLHGQDKPYPAGGGKNKLNADDYYGSYKQSDGSYKTTAINFYSIYIYATNDMIGKTYTFSAYLDLTKEASPSAVLTRCVIGGVNGNGTTISANNKGLSSVSFTPTSTSDYVYLTYGSNGGNNYTISQLQIEEGETATAYAPYSNICPITGYDKIEVLGCGKNLFDGTYSVTGKFLQSDGNEYTYESWNISQYIAVKASTAYYFSNLSGMTSACICWYNKTKEFISSTAISSTGFTDTSPANAFYVRVSVRNNQTNTCVNEGSSAITYEPYHKITDLSYDLPETVYGGTLDVESGVLTVTHGIMDLGSIKGYYDDVNHVFICNNTTILAQAKGSSTPISTYYEGKSPANNNSTAYSKGNNTLCFRWSTFDRFYIRDDAYTDITTLASALSGQKMVYELVTPYTIQLTPNQIKLLKDYNYISTNGTTIALDYRDGEMATLGDVLEAQNKLQEEIDNPISYDGKNYRLGMDATGLYLYNITDDTKAYIQMVTT